jgi:hypothetical protein
MRGVITREVLRQVVAGTYFQLWWLAFDTPVYMSITESSGRWSPSCGSSFQSRHELL